MHGLPPALIQVGSIDLLRSDGEVMAHRLGKAGVPCELQVWNGQMHAFTLLAGVLPEARAALRELGAFAARCTDRPG
ncbi:alpha/beta hydrolase [Saccharopolyspora sp. SCSIO 74807]